MQLSQNAITAIILLTLTVGWLVDIVADFLNLKNLEKNLPEEFKGYYDNKKYLDSQNYLKANTKFGFVTSGFDMVVILVFWFFGGFKFLDIYIRSFEFGSIVSGFFFIGTLVLLKLIISLPFNIYSTFVIEEKFGFNKTTPTLFISDLVKSTLIAMIFGSILLASVLWFFESTGRWAWVLCWIASTFFILIIQYIVPTFIMPLFNKFSPLENGPLKEAIFDYAKSINFSLANIFVMDGSKRSSKSNAFFTGFGKNKRIVLFDTLINEHSTDELVAVLAHEMGHFKKKHIIKRMGLAVLQMGFVFYLISIFISNENLFAAFYVEEMSIYAGLVFFGMLYSPIDLFLSLIFQISSRKDEYEADRFAALTLNEPNPMITALKKLSAHNLSNLTPHPFYVFINYSHPPVMERIKAIKKLVGSRQNR